MADMPEFDALIAQLQTGDPQQRAKAAVAFGDLRKSEALQPLITALSDPNVDVCFEALHALSKIDDDAALEAVQELLVQEKMRLTPNKVLISDAGKIVNRWKARQTAASVNVQATLNAHDSQNVTQIGHAETVIIHQSPPPENSAPQDEA